MHKLLIPFATTAILTTPAIAQEAPVSQARQRADIEKLVGFGTRHTLSSQTDPKRGIGAALNWAEGEFRRSAKACGGCLTIARPETMVSGTRIPTPVRLVDVIAIQRGSDRPDEVVIVQGHIDSRVSDVMDATNDAPGANDNASGTALVLEAARVLSQRKFPTTIVYAVLSGEEQGLYGGKLLADYAAKQGWKVKAVLNNDIVGGTHGSDGLVDDSHVRVFSEGPRADATDKTRAEARRFGGENDSPSRNLSRFVAGLAQPGLEVRQVWRSDRMGRGGDHLPYLEKGYPAIRFSVAIEDYDHQHQDLRTENGTKFGDTIDEMDFPYLAKVTRLNITALAAIASAPMPPAPQVAAALSTSSDITWQAVPGARSYNVWQRRTDATEWEAKPVRANVSDTKVSLTGVRGDDWLFGVSSVGENGAQSPIAAAVPGGAFVPLAQ
ncbi:Zn-dependent M28 family amino/carboxypeptidase [Novosphingobium chloroacetimidivorans]|uniref:Zn-dependent M28 family amino/carboxypeptidase n=1 Tax=Novosphingobium chloroacetimidivorans TaxID=1428314 RepID=A0A7W7K5U4_9SPHN|nr:M20/M25/M40 family metallo-hydrolase [Novosphingobium chloroacetimidivorans]MBB4856817.1 Zn-dependent M28 family amino/carboxypeptidase [Novosphingobium chloroacetimidivorans]